MDIAVLIAYNDPARGREICRVLESIARDDSSEWIDAEERRTQMAIFKRAVETQDGDGLRYCGLFWSAVMDKRQYFD